MAPWGAGGGGTKHLGEETRRKIALSLTTPSPFSHSEQFKHFDLAASVCITSYFRGPASDKVVLKRKPDGNIISIDQLITLDAANM